MRFQNYITNPTETANQVIQPTDTIGVWFNSKGGKGGKAHYAESTCSFPIGAILQDNNEEECTWTELAQLEDQLKESIKSYIYANAPLEGTTITIRGLYRSRMDAVTARTQFIMNTMDTK